MCIVGQILDPKETKKKKKKTKKNYPTTIMKSQEKRRVLIMSPALPLRPDPLDTSLPSLQKRNKFSPLRE